VKALLFVGVSVAALTAQTTPQFRTGTDAVRVDVLVTNGNAPVAGLTATDFDLFDNNVRQQIDAVAIEDLPVSMMLALDTSFSVRGEALGDLKDAAKAAVESLDARDRVALVTFSSEIVLRADWTADRALVARAIDATVAGGGTALWDAVHAAITFRDTQPDRRSLVILFSDGDDTASWLPHTAILDRAKRTDAVVYGIGIGKDRPSMAMFNRSGIELTKGGGELRDALLPQLADITGGQSFSAANTGRLANAFARIVKEFRTRYLLTYSPRNVAQGGWHTLEVKLKNRGGQVRARRGYLR
jgi:VWFA-related protein